MLTYLPKLNLVCGNDELRPAMMHVFLDRKIAVATDAHKVVWFTPSLYFDEEFIERIPEKGLMIHYEDWKKATTCKDIEWKDDTTWRLTFDKKRPVLIEFELYENQSFPPYWKVIPDGFEGETSAIGLDPKFLDQIRQAMGIDKVKLMFSNNKDDEGNELPAHKSPIGVESAFTGGPYPDFYQFGGLLMPNII